MLQFLNYFNYGYLITLLAFTIFIIYQSSKLSSFYNICLHILFIIPSKNMQLSLNYDGRKSETTGVVNTGSVQVRAYF